MTFRPWHLLGIVVGLCVTAIVAAGWWRSRADRGVEGYANRLPADVRTIVRVDLETLRMGGYLDALAGEGADQDPDYRRFVEQIGFDYRRDLDAVLVGFSPTSTYVFAAGDFQWKSLMNYAGASGGTCRSAYCRMPATSPSRWVSYFPLRPRVMALAISSDEWAASTLGAAREDDKAKPWVPSEYPVWLQAPGRVVAESTLIPQALRPFAQIWGPADQVEFTVSGSPGELRVAFTARCAQEQTARAITEKLTEVTKALGAPGTGPGGNGAAARTLAEALGSGRFETRGNTAVGKWSMSSATLLNPER